MECVNCPHNDVCDAYKVGNKVIINMCHSIADNKNKGGKDNDKERGKKDM